MRLAHVAQEGSRLPARAGALGSITRVSHELTGRLGRRAPLTVYSTRGPGDAAEEVVHGIRHVRHADGLDRAALAAWYRWRNRVARRLGLGERLFPASPLYFRGWIARVARHLARHPADVVHLHNVSQFVPPLRRAAPRARLVLQMHCEWLVELPRDAIARRLERVDLVLGVSSHIVRQVQDAHPHVADRCRVLPNGVDPVVFAPRDETLATRPAAIAMLRARLRARGPLLLYVGRLSSEKGVHVLLEAFARVRTRHPAATCAIVGPDWGPIRKVRPAGGSAVGEVIARLDHGYMEHLRRLAAVHGDRVVFAGPVPNEDLPVWYAAADVLVVPSLLEAFGIPAIEGAACALPVVAAATGGLVDTVDATTGIVVPPGDAAALGDALAALLAEPVRARALGRAGRARVLAHYTWDRVADMLAGYYDALLPGAPAPGVYRNVAIDASRSTHSPGTSASSPPNCLQ